MSEFAPLRGLDVHEASYAAAMHGIIPDDHIAESIRQYRAINKANVHSAGHDAEPPEAPPDSELDRLLAAPAAAPAHDTKDVAEAVQRLRDIPQQHTIGPVTKTVASELDRLLANELPFPPLRRREHDAPVAHLSQEGAPYQPYYGHMPAEAVTPHIEHAPSQRFPEGRADLPFDQLKLTAGGLGNKAIDFYKNMLGSVVDPEIATQFPLAAGIQRFRAAKGVKAPLASATQSELERLATEAPQSSQESDVVRVYRGQGMPGQTVPDWIAQGLRDSGAHDAQGRWWTTDKSIADWYARDANEGGHITWQDIPRAVADASKVEGTAAERFSRDPANELFLPSEYGSQNVPPIHPPKAPKLPSAAIGEQLPAVRSGGAPPMRFDPPEPPERLDPVSGTWSYEPWRPNYEVYVADWRDPNLSTWEKFQRRLPADLRIAMSQPESPVIGALDRPSTELMNFTDDFVRSPEMKALSTMDADLFVTEEAKAYAMWEQSRRAQTTPQLAPGPGQVGMQIEGLNPAASFDDIMKAVDPRVRPWFELFRERMKVDQHSRVVLGLDTLDEVPYPYLPRMGQADWDRIMMLQRGNTSGDAVSQLSTTIKGFQQARTYPTMSAGLEKGMAYQDPKRAIIMRLVLSKQLEYTAQMMREMRGRVLFDTKAAAQGELLRRRDLNRPIEDTIADPTHTRDLATRVRNRLFPLGRAVPPPQQPVAVTGLPGPADKIWFVPSKEEALALHQHLKGRQSGGIFGEASMAVNQLFRNPNLLNPAPHVLKNMGYKWMIAATGIGKNPLGALVDLAGYALRMPFDFLGKETPSRLIIGRLSRDASEYAHNTNPGPIARFNNEMPFSRTAATAYENLKPFLETSKPWATAALVGKYLTGNSWSSKYIFSKADPAMKYSLWKMYVEKGMSDTAAANQVNIDLVRYTLRSDLTDTWKNVPLNFFVPWRYGTVTATIKQLSTQPWQTLAAQQATKIPLWAMTRPFKTSLLIGAFMLGREAYYRQTGKTIHLPIDYINGPITQIVSNPGYGALNVAASMYLLGPGGDVARIASQVKDMFGVLKGTEDFSKVMEMYWGVSQLYGSGEEFMRFAKSLDERGVEGADYGALAHVIMGAAFAEYTSYGYTPKHLEHYISGDLLPWHPGVHQNVQNNEARAAAAEQRRPFRDVRKKAIADQQEHRVRP